MRTEHLYKKVALGTILSHFSRTFRLTEGHRLVSSENYVDVFKGVVLFDLLIEVDDKKRYRRIADFTHGPRRVLLVSDEERVIFSMFVSDADTAARRPLLPVFQLSSQSNNFQLVKAEFLDLCKAIVIDYNDRLPVYAQEDSKIIDLEL